MSQSLPTGIVRTAHGYRVFVWVRVAGDPKGRNVSKRFKPDTLVQTMKDWREAQRVDARRKTRTVSTIEDEGFTADVVTYLQAVKAMPSYADRARQMREWILIFGNRKRSTITPADIRTARDRWLTKGPKLILTIRPDRSRHWEARAVPLSASTINQRLRALENFFTVLNGRRGENPVREVPEVDPPDARPRGQSFALALEILAHMPDRTSPKKGGTHEPGSLSRARFEAMLWTGLPGIQLARLKPDMVDWHLGTIRPPTRAKGRQSRRVGQRRTPTTRPLLPQAIPALKRLFALNGNRPFSRQSLMKSIRAAIRNANTVRREKQLPLIPESLTVYDLTRHTFGTEAYRASGNLKSVQELLGHTDARMTARYAQAAIAEHTVKAILELARVARGATRTMLADAKARPRRHRKNRVGRRSA